MCSLEDTITVSFPNGTPVTLTNLYEHGGDRYAKFTKSDNRIVRLLYGSTPKDRVLAKTDILEVLVSLRNKKRDALLDELSKPPPDDLGIDADTERVSKKRRRDLEHTLPQVITIDGPSFGSVEGIQLQVWLSRPEHPLWLHVTPTNIDYMRAIVAAQIQADTLKRSRSNRLEPIEQVAPGVVWAWDRKAYRARFKDNDGNRRTRDFKAVDQAVDFLQCRGDASCDAEFGALQDDLHGEMQVDS